MAFAVVMPATACRPERAPASDDGAPEAAVSADLAVTSGDGTPMHADLGGATAPPVDVPVDGGSGSAVIELASPSVCRTQGSHLVDCRIGTVHIDWPAPAPQLQLRTGLTGNCSTQFDIDLSVQADGDPAVDFYPFHDPRATTVRRDDGDVIHSVTIVDKSPFAGTPAYDVSCRIWVEASVS